MADAMNGNEIQQLNADDIDQLYIHEECMNQCRSSILLQYIDRYPEALAQADAEGYLPLHRLLWNESSSTELALMMMDKYPAALQHGNHICDLPLHIECKFRARSAILSECIERYPEGLAMADSFGYLPLSAIISNNLSTVDATLMIMEKYRPALVHQENQHRYLALHMECSGRCNSTIIAKYIELCPEALSRADSNQYLPLHALLMNEDSSVEDALMMIDKYPAALQHRGRFNQLPLRLECDYQCRTVIIAKCIELYPQAFDDNTFILKRIDKSNFKAYAYLLAIIFTASPMSLYRHNYARNEIRADPYYRRRILYLLPRHVFTPVHDADYRDLNWHPRAVMMMLLSQMKIQSRQQQQISPSNGNAVDSLLAQPITYKWHQQRCLLLRIIKASTLLSNLDVGVAGRAMSYDIGIFQHEDFGDILLRSIFGYL
jgi:hypothetical protein